MILSKKQTIEDLIIESLAQSPHQTGPELLSSLRNRRKNTTKQAMYAVLKHLLEQEIIVKTKSKYFISRFWIEKIAKLLQIKNKQNESIFDLQDGEVVKYNFPSLLICDTYWAHIFYILLKWIPQNKGIFIWNPHEWFIIGRMEQEKEILQTIKNEEKRVFYSISGNTKLDQQFKEKITYKFLKININAQINLKQNYYLNIFDDFIIEVYLHKKITEKIENFFQKNKSLNKENILFFEKIIKEKYPVRMKISRNKKKSNLLRKKLSKDFFIKI